ncbi:MAG TPA: hypothetical protein VFE47_08305 [Tepidisphaeraceae bacterium]|nr:hypothetical protein [Tepidisphaeraceae bacterium]
MSLVIILGFMAGCSALAPEPKPEVPPATISAAAFRAGEPFTVVITGEFFKIKSDNKKDVIVSLNGRNWFPATSISDSSPTGYTAVLPYGVSFPNLWVRVYGMDGEYSQPFLVQGWLK